MIPVDDADSVVQSTILGTVVYAADDGTLALYNAVNDEQWIATEDAVDPREYA
jgi:hypothetical protein